MKHVLNVIFGGVYNIEESRWYFVQREAALPSLATTGAASWGMTTCQSDDMEGWETRAGMRKRKIPISITVHREIGVLRKWRWVCGDRWARNALDVITLVFFFAVCWWCHYMGGDKPGMELPSVRSEIVWFLNRCHWSRLKFNVKYEWYCENNKPNFKSFLKINKFFCICI